MWLNPQKMGRKSVEPGDQEDGETKSELEE